MDYKIVRVTDRPELKEQAARWFHEKLEDPPWRRIWRAWEGTPGEKGPVPQWYMALDGERIIGGMGVIENDFHDRKDLAPNVCAVYTEEDWRGRGVAGSLLRYVCADMKEKGIDPLYLITDHTSFYERYGWNISVWYREKGKRKR